MKELRCSSTIHGILRDDGTFEVKCSSRRCGAGAGVSVFHYFDPLTGEAIETKKFRDPQVKFSSTENPEVVEMAAVNTQKGNVDGA